MLEESSLNSPGEVSTFQLENRLARWAVLGLEEIDNSDWMDWVPTRNFHVPNINDILVDIVIKLGMQGSESFSIGFSSFQMKTYL